MPTITRDERPSLHYTLCDYTDPWTDAPYLFLQHGYGRNSAFWYQWVPRLSRQFRVVCPDLRGHGQSGREFDLDTGFTLETLSDDVIAIADALGVDKFHYAGESIGGLVGLATAGRYPDRVQTLTNVSGPVFISEGARVGYALGEASWPDAVRNLGAREWLDRTNASTRFPPDMNPGFLTWYTDTVEKTGTEVLAALAQFALDANATPYLPKITAPMLCLFPQNGAIANDEQRLTLERNVRDLTLAHVSTTYHMIQHIVPEECTNALCEHIARNTTTGDRT
ncbi:alpha/beta fold hydrolase [Pusillimonas sp. ANT_WB101]|uniref:alpha/beta fold hydrolase n=1 Tax=Pusillimonas sp. ANT_WB101 TaxID=2597356 RepID=UPI0011EE2AA6|nr:alpha/beta hydrolase [Pusillimonas sp. ANT_WB101]KAA0892854.1 alpha/beta hydrolase [Pusillimonas sp. ANT_WB101]